MNFMTGEILFEYFKWIFLLSYAVCGVGVGIVFFITVVIGKIDSFGVFLER